MKRLLCIMLSLLVCIGLTACINTDVDSSSDSSTPASSQSSEQSEESSEESSEEATTEVNIGDTITLGDWNITVNSFELMDSIQNSTRIFEADEGYKFVKIDLTVTNNGAEEEKFAKSFVTLGSDIVCTVLYQGNEYMSTQLLAYDEDLHNNTVAPSETVTGILVFSVETEKAQSGELTFEIALGDEANVYKLV